MRVLELNYPIRTGVEIDKSESPYVMAFNISMEDISNFCKSRLNEKDREEFKDNTFYPIQIKQMADLSFDVILGMFR